MNFIYILVICIGSLGFDDCDVTQQFSYPSAEACLTDLKKIKDKPVYCVELEVKVKNEIDT